MTILAVFGVQGFFSNVTLIISLFFVNCRLMSIEMALARESFLADRTFRPLASLILGHPWVPIGDSKLWPDCLGCSFSCYHAALAERSINIRVSSGHLIGLTVGFFSIPPVSRYVISWWLMFQSVILSSVHLVDGSTRQDSRNCWSSAKAQPLLLL